MNNARFPSMNLSRRHMRCIRWLAMTLFCCIVLTSCSRAQLRQLINKLGSPDQEKPEVYHEFEGFSPGAKKTHGKEDFTRYHYYIAPEQNDIADNEPDIYFRQDYEVIDPIPTFDEEQYWREHPLVIDDDPLPETKTE